ncbi:MAG TPA: hypothetical protein VE197_23395 [Mycobacterium sp.]|nr:hypothetical protein [Mycobacterium sp.]
MLPTNCAGAAMSVRRPGLADQWQRACRRNREKVIAEMQARFDHLAGVKGT